MLEPFFMKVATLEVAYVTIWYQTFCLLISLTGVHFLGELKNVGHVCEQKNQVPTNQNSRNSWYKLYVYQKRDSGTGIFLWILRKFKNTFFTEHFRTDSEFILEWNRIME